MQQQMTSLREYFLEGQEGTHLPKSSPNLYSSLMSHGSEQTVQNGNNSKLKKYIIDKNLNFTINF